jgi:galactokinase
MQHLEKFGLNMTGVAYQSVIERFENLTGKRPVKVCLAPGRTNLIGEHIDYNGFGVFPCAVGRYTYLAIGLSGETDRKAIRIASVDSDGSQFDIILDEVARVPKETHHWSNYVLAAYLGLRESGVFLPKGIDIVVGGDLPRACGLSSSSSLVVAAAMSMAALRLSRQHISPEHLAEICMKAEWHVGTAGGGMDQAAILLSQAGFASHIEFNPLRVNPIKLPSGVSFVVANSFARSAKAETAHKYFNKRVFECKLGQRMIRIAKALPLSDPLADTYASIQADLGNPGVDSLLTTCRDTIPSGGLSKDTVKSMIGREVLDTLLTGRWGTQVWDLNEEFFVQSRAIHVFSEADRVEKFKSAALRNETGIMADCINESGRSLDEEYDCSCIELRDLIGCMKQSGCVAARLVGAGFGGCAIGMVPSDQVMDTIQRVHNDFFAGHEHKEKLCFAFEPAQGAHFITDF